MESNGKQIKNAVIIGAGPAGLTAGYCLLKQIPGVTVTILEQSDCVGGISRTVEHNGNRMDIGGHRFFSKSAQINQLWQELLPLQGKPAFDDLKLKRHVSCSGTGPDPEKTDEVMLKRRRISRIYYHRHFFDYPVKMNIRTIMNMGFLTTLSVGFQFLCAMLHKKEESSLENFYINRFGKKLYTMFFESYTEKLWGRHPRDISADWGAQRVKGLSVLAVLKDIIVKNLPAYFQKRATKETSLIEEFLYPKYGPGQLWQTAAAKIEQMGGKIIYGCEVKQIKTSDHHVQSLICCQNGEQIIFPCDIVLSSMPLKDLAEGMERMPEDIRKIASGLPYRDFVTVGLLLQNLNLQNTTEFQTLGNIIPDCWIYVQDAGVKLGRIQIFNNWSPYLVHDPEHQVWIGLEYFCCEGDEFWEKTPEEWKCMAVAELEKMGIVKPGATIFDYHVEKVKKAYPAYFDSYTEIDQLITYLNTFDNLYCIGRNGQHRYNNMDHSMLTAMAAVKSILTPDDPAARQAVWNVNTEKEYHEK